MVMRIDDELRRLVCDGLDFFHQAVEIFALRRGWRIRGILSVNDNEALICNTDQCVRAAASHFVKIRLQHFDFFNGLSGCRAPSTGALRERVQGSEADHRCYSDTQGYSA